LKFRDQLEDVRSWVFKEGFKALRFEKHQCLKAFENIFMLAPVEPRKM